MESSVIIGIILVVVIGILALCLISWNVYVYSILKCLKEK